MSKIRSLPRFCIALSAAVLLTGGLASANDGNMPNHWLNHSGFLAGLNKMAAPWQALAELIGPIKVSEKTRNLWKEQGLIDDNGRYTLEVLELLYDGQRIDDWLKDRSRIPR